MMNAEWEDASIAMDFYDFFLCTITLKNKYR